MATELEDDFVDYSLTIEDIMEKHGFTDDGAFERISKRRNKYRKAVGAPHTQGLTRPADAPAQPVLDWYRSSGRYPKNHLPEGQTITIPGITLPEGSSPGKIQWIPTPDEGVTHEQMERLINVIEKLGDDLVSVLENLANK